MLIRFIGPQVAKRMLGGFEWSRRTGYVQDVPLAMAQYLLTTPGEKMAIDERDPVAVLCGGDVDLAGRLVLENVGSVEDLATFSDRSLKRLAKTVDAPEGMLESWRGARELEYVPVVEIEAEEYESHG